MDFEKEIEQNKVKIHQKHINKKRITFNSDDAYDIFQLFGKTKSEQLKNKNKMLDDKYQIDLPEEKKDIF
eukprot:Pgem_evm1s15498